MSTLVLADLIWHPLVPAGAGNRQRILSLAAYGPGVRAHLIGPGPFPDDTGLPVVTVKPWRPFWRPPWFNPDLLGFLPPRAIRRMARAAAAVHPDIVLSEGLWAVPAGSQAARLMGRPLAITVNNIEHVVLLQRRKLTWATAVRFIERSWYARADLLIAMSTEDARRLECVLGRSCPRVEVVPNGVEPPPEPGAQADVPHPNVMFLGKTDYPPNAEAIQELEHEWLPAARSLGIPVTAVVVGGPTAPARRGDLVFSGYVDDVWPWINAADVCVAPLISGSGTRLKVLTYLAAGRPVIATEVAVEGLGMAPEIHYLRAKTGEEFAAALARVRGTPDLAAELGRRGKELTQRFAWSSIGKQWAGVLRSAVGGNPTSSSLLGAMSRFTRPR